MGIKFIRENIDKLTIESIVGTAAGSGLSGADTAPEISVTDING